MKFTVSFFLMIFLSFVSSLYFPWWSIAVITFIVALFIPQPPGRSYLTGFLALNLLWAGIATWIAIENEFIFAHRISLLVLKMDNIVLLITATAMIGGIVGGLGAITGSYFRRIFSRWKPTTTHN